MVYVTDCTNRLGCYCNKILEGFSHGKRKMMTPEVWRSEMEHWPVLLKLRSSSICLVIARILLSVQRLKKVKTVSKLFLHVKWYTEVMVTVASRIQSMAKLCSVFFDWHPLHTVPIDPEIYWPCLDEVDSFPACSVSGRLCSYGWTQWF